MAGLYIHIPFCKSRCIYCDFYSTISQTSRTLFIEALLKELELKKPFIESIPIETIYFGGGTPSLLTINELRLIMDKLRSLYDSLFKLTEVTLEANPDDLSLTYLKQLYEIGFNRISMGVQSFIDSELLFLGRRHTATQVTESVELARKAGFSNISLDLIYGLPQSSFKQLTYSVQQLCALGVEHISAYALTYEGNTPLVNKASRGEITIKSDENVAAEYQFIVESLAGKGYYHYEISNFAQNGFEAKHNSSYWHRVPYIGFGPSAHSFICPTQHIRYKGVSFLPMQEARFANVANLKSYIAMLSQNQLPIGFSEALTNIDRYNEIVMLGLRTKAGIDLMYFEQQMGKEQLQMLLSKATPFIRQQILCCNNNTLYPTDKGMFLIDGVIAELFI